MNGRCLNSSLGKWLGPYQVLGSISRTIMAGVIASLTSLSFSPPTSSSSRSSSPKPLTPGTSWLYFTSLWSSWLSAFPVTPYRSANTFAGKEQPELTRSRISSYPHAEVFGPFTTFHERTD